MLDYVAPAPAFSYEHQCTCVRLRRSTRPCCWPANRSCRPRRLQLQRIHRMRSHEGQQCAVLSLIQKDKGDELRYLLVDPCLLGGLVLDQALGEPVGDLQLEWKMIGDRDLSGDGANRRIALRASRRFTKAPITQRRTQSQELVARADAIHTSLAAPSGPSEPWQMLRPTSMAKSPRMVPQVLSAGRVAPSRMRPILMESLPSQTMATTGPEIM